MPLIEIVKGPCLAAAVRRWDRIAAQQLAEVAHTLAEENDYLRRELMIAEDCAVMWERTAEAERDGRTYGLTIDGAIVQTDRPITTIDDDPEYP